ncbi:uncharacterized protein LOC8064799 [Sorghum bicolor]|uniref:uncharacterized protein LOC8064799 n=1 Tax=Sorghum bicolor TaxID=4558 RepID=UPI000B426B70|nr:uncharacterized protein LOC8064799 [Sorghum bicolor]XP_021317222.1 uncharacterized protein LOC8064799 [Sorghum bicolor]|eukprot:XP_002450856.2 uncharacterized protein LOC8064799 [Sorghum bicolor]
MRPVKLFGVRIGDKPIRKSASMGNIAHLAAEGSGGGGGGGSREEGYGSDGERPHKKRVAYRRRVASAAALHGVVPSSSSSGGFGCGWSTERQPQDERAEVVVMGLRPSARRRHRPREHGRRDDDGRDSGKGVRVLVTPTSDLVKILACMQACLTPNYASASPLSSIVRALFLGGKAPCVQF